MAGRSFKAGMTSAINVTGRAKSSGQDSGSVVPSKIPAAVLNCQEVHKVKPAPRKNQ